MAVTLIGPKYTDVGRWQSLRLGGIPTLLTRQVHVLRAQLKSQIDQREAYLDAVLLNVFGGSGVTNVWIDGLEVTGYASTPRAQPSLQGPALSAEPAAASPATNTSDTNAAIAAGLVPVRLPPVQPYGNGASRPITATSGATSRPNPTPNGRPSPSDSPAVPSVVPVTAPPPRHTVKLDQSVLLVDGRPTFARAIQHCGEPLATLKKLGFNAVWLRRLPAPEMLEEANRLGLWLICPPPRDLAAVAEISPAFDPVLAWDLGDDLTDADLEPTENWEKQVRAADRRMNRPQVCRPRNNLRGYSRVADFLLIDRRPLGTSLQMTDYATWVRQQPLLARPDTPIWTTVQTQPNEALRQQLIAMQPGTPPPLGVPSEQIRLLAYTAVASGSRGLLFLSDSALDSPDPETQQRAMALELLNLELELMEPWAAAGTFVASAESSSREVVGAVLRTEHARLLLPIWSAPMSQCVPPQSATNALTLVVPAVPEASDVYELIPSGVQPLKRKRVAGGLSVTLEEFGLTTQVLLAQDPLIVAAVHRRAAEVGRRAAELQCRLAAQKLNSVQVVARQLVARTPVAGAAQWLDTARKEMQNSDRLLAANDAPGSARSAQRAMRALRLVERGCWDATVKNLSSPVTSPATVSFDTLPMHWRLVDRLRTCQFGPNRIAGGDFEDIDTMTRAGWRYIQHGSASVRTAVDLAPDSARSGLLGLRLIATAEDPAHPPAVVEAPPILFTSPSVQVEAGQIVCIYGWVRIPKPITCSTDGLLIVDSLTGEALADRIGKTKGWRQFSLYRIAPQSGAMCVTFALSGLGEARLDDVVIQVVEGPAAVSQR
jgi:hypothetical protein